MTGHSPSSINIATSSAALRSKLHIHGLAVVSSDGSIGRSPDDITFDWSSGADKEHFFASLDRASLCIMGRRTHQLYPNMGKRSRLVISRSVTDGLTDPTDPNAIFCNVDALSPAELLRRIVTIVGSNTEKPICILGGAQIYKLFLEHPCLGFDSFDLTVETDRTHTGGIPFLPEAAEQGVSGIIQTLTRIGLAIDHQEFLTPSTARILLRELKKESGVDS
jgi:dihydrofolate reductase